MDLGDDAVQAGLRGEGVADQGDADAVGEGAGGEEGEVLLGAHLPVAAVDEDQRRPGGIPREVVDAVALGRAVAHVQDGPRRRPQALAAGGPIRDNFRAVPHRRAVVVRGVEGSPVHSAIQFGHMGQVIDAIEEVYRRIEANASNPVFIHVVPKAKALERAAAVEKTPKVSPLWGKPFVVQDNRDDDGLPTTAACPAFAYTPKKTATAVQKILAAGGVLVGKTNMDQFATGLTGTRSPSGAVQNAFDPKYISGGSSSGSAVAVALGIVGYSLGTDTAGSGRVPAAFNGLVGFKPTRGLVSTAGVVPAVRSLDCVSIFALSCNEALQVLAAIEGPDAEDPYSRSGAPVQISPQQFKFAVPSQLEFHGDSGYAKLFAQAILKLRQIGGTPVEIDFAPFVEAGALLYGPWVAERAAHLEPHLDKMLPVIKEILEGAKKYSAVDFFKARNRLDELKLKARDTFKQADVILVPTTPTIYQVAQVEKKPIELNNHLGHYTSFTNLLDLAAISLPAGMRQDGVPFGISLIAPAFTDKSLLALGARFQG